MSDNQLFFLVFVAPWLAPLVLGGLVAQFFAIRAELTRSRVVAKRRRAP